MTSGIGIISVGAVTKAEQKELRDRVDDAFAASKAALREGIVPGGGSMLLKAKKQLDVAYEKNSPLYNKLVGDEIIGVKILCDSLEAPVRKILENAGIDASLIVSKLLENDIENEGYDVLTKKFADMPAAGIIDPTEVVVNEVQNAVSVASLLLTTECLICEMPEPKSNNAAPQGMPPMPM